GARGDADGGPRGATGRRLRAAAALSVALPVVAAALPHALALGDPAPAVAPVCRVPVPRAVRCAALLLTDPTQWKGALPPLPSPGDVLGLLTGTTTTTRPTTTTTRPTTTTTRPTTTTTGPTTTTTGPTTTTTRPTTTTTGPTT